MEFRNNEIVPAEDSKVVSELVVETDVLPVVETEEMNGGGDEVMESGEEEVRVTKKRGRPRKETRDFMVMPEYSSGQQKEKRGRGRPKGSGKWQTMGSTSLGRMAILEDKGSFKPHVLAVGVGEDVYDKLWDFSENTPDSVLVLSASGSLSMVHVRQPSVLRGGVLRYEGRYDILNLQGSHTYTGNGGHCGKNCCLSVQLVDHKNRCFGGAVAGSLIAAGPVILILATFKEVTNEQMSKMKQASKKRKKSKVSAETNGKLPAAADAITETPAPANVPVDGDDDRMMMNNGGGPDDDDDADADADAEENENENEPEPEPEPQHDDAFVVSGEDRFSEFDAAATGLID